MFNPLFSLHDSIPNPSIRSNVSVCALCGKVIRAGENVCDECMNKKMEEKRKEKMCDISRYFDYRIPKFSDILSDSIYGIRSIRHHEVDQLSLKYSHSHHLSSF